MKNLLLINTKNLQVRFEKIILFLFIASWVNLPGFFYEKMAWSSLTAGHGKNVVPYFLPVLFIFVLYYFFRLIILRRFTNIFQAILGMKFYTEDIFFLLLIGFMIIANNLMSFNGFPPANLRMVLPIIVAHFFYFFCIRFTSISIIPNVDKYFIKYVLASIFFIIFIQLMMFIGIIPGLEDGFVDDVKWKLLHFVRVNAHGISFSSYIAFFLLFILLYYKVNGIFKPYFFWTLVASVILVLTINQTRGAIVGAFFVLLTIFFTNVSIKKFFGLILLVIISFSAFMFVMELQIPTDPEGIGAYQNFSNHRVFSLLDSSASHRLDISLHAFNKFLERPFFGHGSSFAQELRYTIDNTRGMVVHTYYLRFLVSYGLIGLLFFLAYCKTMFLYRYTYINFIGLIVIFIIFTFETYLFHYITILALLFRLNLAKK